MSSTTPQYDVFVSHASEDKDAIARPLANALMEFGVKVWYDEFALSVGDSLSRSIDKGLADSRYGVVILSRHFLEKGWPEYELRGLVAKAVGAAKTILPIWHGLRRNDIVAFSPTLADAVALTTDKLSSVELAAQIIAVARPDLFEKIQRRAAFLAAKRTTQTVDLKTLKFPPPRHASLPADLIARIRLIRAALLGVYSHSMAFWVDGFRGDAHPSVEVRVWERIAATYIEYAAMTALTPEQHKIVFDIVSGMSIGTDRHEQAEQAVPLPSGALEVLESLFKSQYPVYDLDDTFPKTYTASNDVARIDASDREHFPKDVPDELVRQLIKDDVDE